MNHKIFSESNPLRFVIIHKPGKEHSFITPDNISEKIEISGKLKDNPNFLLFDDLIQIKKAIKEHEEFSKILNTFTDGNTYEFSDLLKYTLRNESSKKNLIKRCISNEFKTYNNQINLKKLQNLNLDLLVEVLITGYLKTEKVFTHPLPNLIFTRDLAVVIGKTILITWNKKQVRNRENILSEFIFSNYEHFNNLRIYEFNKYYPNLSIEGGDILVLDNKRVCIGISERTSIESIKKINKIIFQEGFDSVFAINLPKKRAYMHLDTVFTIVSNNEALVYPPFLNDNNKIHIFKKEGNNYISDDNIIETLKKDGLQLKPIFSGGKSKIMQKREQWTDGANSFALEPGKIICYKCNEYTLNELKKNKYKIVSSKEYINKSNEYNNSKNKLAITLDSSELVRGRGGPRCLTLPLLRI